MDESRTRITPQLIIGLAVAVVGVLFTLDNLGVVASEPILRWWPIVIVLVGVSKLLGLGTRPQMPTGLFITGVGLVMLVSSLDLVGFGLWDLWPLALVAAGVVLVTRGVQRTRERTEGADPDDFAQSFVIMGGVVRRLNSGQFRGGEATAVMGGVDLDMRGATAAGPTVVIDCLAWWGGIEIKVPPDWKVTSEVVPVMAGVEDKTKAPAEARTHLILRGLIVMSGIEIGN